MMKLLSTLCIGLIVAGQMAQAQPLRTYWSVRSTASAVDFYNSNYGVFGLNIAMATAGFIYPRGSGMSYMFGSGLWFGCKKSVGGILRPATFVAYNPNSASSWARPGEFSASPKEEPFYTSTAFSRATGTYTGPDSASVATKWPLWLAPQDILTPMNEGNYEPNNSLRTAIGGTYTGPAFMPYVDEQHVARFNDGDITRYENSPSLTPGVYPLGLQIQQGTYAWNTGRLRGTVLVHYQIRNMSNDTLRDCLAATIADIDIGAVGNDRGRFYAERPELRSSYFWTQPESGKNYGALVVTLVEAPVTNTEGFILDDQRLGYYRDGRIGTCQIWSIEEDPTTDRQRYDFMTSHEIDSAGSPSNDHRSALGSGRFHMRPGDVAHFTVAYSVIPNVPEMGKTRRDDAPDIASMKPATELEQLVEPLMQYYYSPNGFQGASGVREDNTAAAGTLTAVPNPAHESAQIRFTGVSGALRMSIVDVLGREMESRDLQAAGTEAGSVMLDCRTYAPGLYFVRLENTRGTVAVTPLVINR